MHPTSEVDLVIALNYYVPYVSGLTDTARAVAEGLAAKDWRVSVVTTRHDRELPAQELIAGVEVLRTPVVARIGKGTISPSFPIVAARAARRAAVVNLHMPMLEAGLIARRVAAVPLVATYQCDVSLPAGMVNNLQVGAVDRSSRAALRRARVVVPSSDDYAEHSRLWPAMAGRTHAIAPPCRDRPRGKPAFRRGTGVHVGFLGRIVEEKGLEYLVEGFLRAAQPDDRLLVGGDYTKVAGGSVIDAVRAKTGGDPRISFLGFIADDSVADFYASLDVFALPSVNSLEAFGIVQVEAMMSGVPVIASDLPGVRGPVRETGFGIVVPPRDPEAIAAAIATLRTATPDRLEGARRARERYTAAVTVAEYEGLFRALGAGPRTHA